MTLCCICTCYICYRYRKSKNKKSDNDAESQFNRDFYREKVIYQNPAEGPVQNYSTSGLPVVYLPNHSNYEYPRSEVVQIIEGRDNLENPERFEKFAPVSRHLTFQTPVRKAKRNSVISLSNFDLKNNHSNYSLSESDSEDLSQLEDIYDEVEVYREKLPYNKRNCHSQKKIRRTRSSDVLPVYPTYTYSSNYKRSPSLSKRTMTEISHPSGRTRRVINTPEKTFYLRNKYDKYNKY